MAEEKRARKDKPTKKTARQGQVPLPQDDPSRPAQAGTKDADAGPGDTDMGSRVPGPADEGAAASNPQPSSLNNAQYLWLSRRPAWFQNAILIVFMAASVLGFSQSFVKALEWLLSLLPKNIPAIYCAIRNESEDDVTFDAVGDFTILGWPPKEGTFDLAIASDGDAPRDLKTIRVPANGKKVRVEATIRNSRDFYSYYRRGEYPLTLIFGVGAKRIAMRMDPFSKANLREDWAVSVPSDRVPGRVINVCFGALDNAQDRLEDETQGFIDDLTNKVRLSHSFKSITPEFFNEIKNEEPDPAESNVYAKVEVAICRAEKGAKDVHWEVTGTKGQLGKPGSWPYAAGAETLTTMIMASVTQGIGQSYPIEGRIREVLGDAKRLEDKCCVEIGIGRLAGVREEMVLHVYAGPIDARSKVGDVEITAAWTETCEGRLINWRGPADPKVIASLLVSSRMPE